MVTFIRLGFIESVLSNGFFLTEQQRIKLYEYIHNLLLASSEIRIDYDLNQAGLTDSLRLYLNTLLKRMAEFGVRYVYDADLAFLTSSDLSVLHHRRFDLASCQFFFDSDLEIEDIKNVCHKYGLVVNTKSTLLAKYSDYYKDVKYFSKGFQNLRQEYFLPASYKTKALIIVDPYFLTSPSQVLINVIIWLIKLVGIRSSQQPIEFLVFFNNEKCRISTNGVRRRVKDLQKGIKGLTDCTVLLQLVSCTDYHARPSFLGYSLVTNDYGWALFDNLKKDVHFASVMLGDCEFPHAYMRQLKKYMKIYRSCIGNPIDKLYGDNLPLLQQSANLYS